LIFERRAKKQTGTGKESWNIVCTNVIYNPKKDEGNWVSGLKFQNFIISTADIQGGQWSDPVYFDLHGIDPDLFFDDSGRA
jgi:beta-xylosidase